MGTVLVIGAAGQIGTDLTLKLASVVGRKNLLATDKREAKPAAFEDIDYLPLDVLDCEAVRRVLMQYRPTEIYHLAALLSGTAEKNPDLAWKLNVDATRKLYDMVLEIVPTAKVFSPSSIAAFGPRPDRDKVPQQTYLNPTSTYGVTKVTCERLNDYYFHKKGLDVRSLRFPGLISYSAHAGGGTTDYAVEVFHAAVAGHDYECFVKAETTLPMLYMEDAINAILALMAAPSEKLTVRDSYNLHGFSLSPEQCEEAIKHYYPTFAINYKPDFRQAIADSWPKSLDDTAARTDWGWKPQFTFEDVCRDMIHHLAGEAKVHQ